MVRPPNSVPLIPSRSNDDTVLDIAQPPSIVRTDAHIALGPRWLAYPSRHADAPLGVVSAALEPSRMQTAVHLAQQTGQTLYKLGDTGVKTVSSMISGKQQRPRLPVRPCTVLLHAYSC
jgi:hypothetical protein